MEELLKATRVELQNFELFKQQVDEEKLTAVQELEATLKAHYDESTKLKLDEKEIQFTSQFDQQRFFSAKMT